MAHKKVLLLSATMAMALVLAGCSNPDQPNVPESQKENPATSQHSEVSVASDSSLPGPASSEAAVYQVRFQQGKGYELKGASTVKSGESYSFTLSLSEGYKKSDDFAVKANGVALAAQEDGSYQVSKVESDLFITVSGVEEITFAYHVLSSVDGAVLSEGGTFAYSAESISFTLALADDYSQCLTTAEVYQVIGESKTLVSGNAGVYSFANPKQDFDISVENLSLNEYTVSFFGGSDESEGAAYTATVTAGETVSEATLAAAKSAIEAANAEDELKVLDWVESFEPIHGAVSYHAILGSPIRTAAEFQAIEATSSYYLASDIDLTSLQTCNGSSGQNPYYQYSYTPVAEFSGILEGNGHLIRGMNPVSGGDGALLFKRFSGEVRNLKVLANIRAGSWNFGSVAYLMEGGKIDGVEAWMMISNGDSTVVGTGGLVSIAWGGEINNCTVHLNLPTWSSSDDVGGIVHDAGETNNGASHHVTLNNDRVLLPKGVDPSVASVAKNAVPESTLTGCSVANESTVTAVQDAFSAGTATNEQHMGSTVYTATASHADKPFANLDLTNVKEFSFWLYASSTGASYFEALGDNPSWVQLDQWYRFYAYKDTDGYWTTFFLSAWHSLAEFGNSARTWTNLNDSYGIYAWEATSATFTLKTTGVEVVYAS